MPNTCLPAHLKGKRHNDYWWIFSWIPRSFTSWCLFQPPICLIGYKVHYWTNMDGTQVKFYPMYQSKWVFFSWDKFKRGWGPNPIQRTHNAWYIGFPWYFYWSIFDTGWYIRIGARWDDIDKYFTVLSFRTRKWEK